MKVLESTVFCASAFLKWKNILILPFRTSQLQELQSPAQTIKVLLCQCFQTGIFNHTA